MATVNEKKTLIGKKEMVVMDATAQSIKGVLDDLSVKLSILDADIKADKKGKADYDKLLGRLEARKADLLNRIKESEAWADNYDKEIGPSMNRFGDMTADIAVIYEKAKKGHASGIKLLEKEFGYHPAFKRPGDTFTAIPFKPKKA
jgi:hypothetical protein